MHRPSCRAIAAASVIATTAAVMALPGMAEAADVGPTFYRTNVGTVSGAAFTVEGEVFPGEKNLVTTGYGTLTNGIPSGGGTLQVYRPGSSLLQWRTVNVFGSTQEIVFPNRPTIADVNADGLNDLIVPAGYFFDTEPRSGITWWENKGLDSGGNARGFIRHDLLSNQPAAYHGVEYVDLDGDGIRDLVTTAEDGGVADSQYDDTVRLEYLRGQSGGGFAAPVTLADGSGGSHPVVADIDGDDRPDIVSSQFFNLTYTAGERAAFMWFRQSGDASAGLTASNFTKHLIAPFSEAGFGFQIQPVLGFREPGKVSWIGTNHQSRCFVSRVLAGVLQGEFNVPEKVMEFLPGADVTQPWTVKTLSTPEQTVEDPTACDPAFNVKDSTVAIHPTDYITARSAGGQAAPGVFGYGDLDGDGDIDLAVSGDGDRRLFWIEQRPGRSPDTVLHTLTAPGEQFGQSGGAVVKDLDRDGKPEVVFSSFDTNTVAVWSTRKVVPSVVKPTTKVVSSATRMLVTPPAKRPKAGSKASWRVRLTGVRGVGIRRASVTFQPRGSQRILSVGSVRLNGSGAARVGRWTWRPRRAGVLTFRYAGTRVNATAEERASTVRVRVRVR